MMSCNIANSLYEQLLTPLRESDVFENVQLTSEALLCKAKDIESDAFYDVRVCDDGKTIYVGLYTPDRWLSESIETDLLHLGENMEELLEEELVELGLNERFLVEHFRDEQKRYVFRSPVALSKGESLECEQTVDRIRLLLLGYEACFRQLGDMSPDDDAL